MMGPPGPPRKEPGPAVGGRFDRPGTGLAKSPGVPYAHGVTPGEATPLSRLRPRRPPRIVRRGLCALVLALLTGVARAGGRTETAGDVLQLALPVAAFGLALGHRDKEGAVEYADAAAMTLGITYGLKYTVHERRPNGGEHSFPSGHTSISFSAAEFVRERYGWPAGAPAYVLAAFVGYSRIESRAHHPRDVAAGAAIGALSAFTFTTRPPWRMAASGDGRGFSLFLGRGW